MRVALSLSLLSAADDGAALAESMAMVTAMAIPSAGSNLPFRLREGSVIRAP
jgi:hypothetical protein